MTHLPVADAEKWAALAPDVREPAGRSSLLERRELYIPAAAPSAARSFVAKAHAHAVTPPGAQASQRSAMEIAQTQPELPLAPLAEVRSGAQLPAEQEDAPQLQTKHSRADEQQPARCSASADELLVAEPQL